MALFSFWVLLGVMSLLPSLSQYKEASAVCCRCLDTTEVISEVSGKCVPIGLKCPTLGQNAGSGILQRCSEIAAC